MPARALTVAVVVMGVLIVAGVAALTVGVARRAVHPTRAAEATPFAAAPIDLPKGAHVTAISTGTDRLVVAVALPGGSEELLVVDLATGRRLGTIPVHAAP